ncbi:MULTISPECIES: hypothetical protein [unclassified Saccharopolyspora]|uniref:hypothetical protein n=1 Tax=unclassified Saccharopolyspora TaxID=2646250 RepID=UPI001CD2579B|nr:MULTISPECIES: hypothetical protein [unclassified Saccharopolyspora]MCA1196181.1 hypothetical protein [Saccharopolyspora sp. 6V]MCA1278309.1 hypothetical protein [Saccharopolyspora sp. 7B]
MTRSRSGAAVTVLDAGRWTARRENEPNPLWGSNGVAFGPDGRLHVAQYLAGQISAVDVDSGEVEAVLPVGGPVRSPDDLDFAADGSMYITDLNPGLVWRCAPDGELAVVARGLRCPNGITCVGNRVFVNEMYRDGRVLELFPDGREPVVLTGGLAMGNAMQLGPDGSLYYPHMMTGEVWRISPEGGAAELVAEQVHEPVAVRFDRAGELVVLSRGVAGIVTRFDAEGSRTITRTGIAGMDNAAFDAENRMLVSSFASGGVTRIEADGPVRPVVARGFNGPFGVAADSDGRWYAADHFRLGTAADELGAEAGGPLLSELGGFVHGIAADSGVLHVTSQFGEVRTVDGGRVRVRASGLDGPGGIAVAAGGALVVAETGAGRVLRIDAADEVTVLADGLDGPVDVALDEDGRCFATEQRGGRVLRIGDGAVDVLADGLAEPQGLARLGGELFVVEAGARRLLSLDPDTGARRAEVAELPVDALRDPEPVVTPGIPGQPRAFAGIAATPDGALLLSAGGEGTVLRLTRG